MQLLSDKPNDKHLCLSNYDKCDKPDIVIKTNASVICEVAYRLSFNKLDIYNTNLTIMIN